MFATSGDGSSAAIKGHRHGVGNKYLVIVDLRKAYRQGELNGRGFVYESAGRPNNGKQVGAPACCRFLLRHWRARNAACVDDGTFDPPQFQDVPIQFQQAALCPAHLGLAFGKSDGFLRQSTLVLVSIRTGQDRCPRAGFLKALVENGFLALGGFQRLANRTSD
ncbi:MAG: hypothetical protein ABW175_13565 [Bradyrhizobium sp.]